jgi:hypothetical protein
VTCQGEAEFLIQIFSRDFKKPLKTWEWLREQDDCVGAEKVEETEVGPASTAENIEAGKFWDPYQAPPTRSLQTYEHFQARGMRAFTFGLH